MRAMVFTAPGQVGSEDVAAPSPAEGTVLDVEAAGVCGSELHAFHEPGLRKLPLVMGHEFTGRTADGTRVVVNPLTTCGQCDACHRREPELCASRRIVGIDSPGAFAEQVAVAASACLSIGDDIGPEAGTLVEPLANGVHAWGRAALSADSRVAVIGGGPIGLMATYYATSGLGLSPVVFEPRAERRAVALRLGAAAALGAPGETLAGEGGFDVVLDAVGSHDTRVAALDAVRAGGIVVCLGLASAGGEVNGQTLVRQEKTITGSYCYTPEDFGRALDVVPGIDVGWVDSVSLDDAPRVFTELATGRSSIIKAVVRP